MSHAQKVGKAGAGRGKPAPKGKKAAGGAKKPEDDREETLQAVVCSDRAIAIVLGNY
jgi:hypothetical protein